MRSLPGSAFACLLVPVLCAAASAQVSRTFPMDVTRFDTALQEIELAPRVGDFAALANLQRARFDGVLLPDGTTVDLDLRRIDLDRLGLGLRVNGKLAPNALDRLDLSVWTGAVADDPGSEVGLSFSRFGSRGWIRHHGEVFHLLAGPGEKGWSESTAKIVSEEKLAARGIEPRNLCRSEELPLNNALPKHTVSSSPTFALTTTLYECKVSVETDYDLYQVFGSNLSAEMSYVTTLIAWVSMRYEEQVQTVLTYPYVQFYTTAADPWTAQDIGGNSVDLLYEFQAAWQGNVPAGGELGAFLSGAGLGGGVAWLPGLCNSPYNFSVSGNIDGQVTFPVQQGPSNWDFMVFAHEIGHNFNAPHTHDYCPPLDQCAPSGYFGQCQTQQVCTNQGTIMSYCHLCSGGLSNITTYFHPANVFDMRSWVESTCLPVYCNDPSTYCVAKQNSLGCMPAIGSSGHPTLSGLDDFHWVATSVLNNKAGFAFWGYAPANVPFQGGTRCVAVPTKRTPLQDSGGNPPPNDCSGVYDFFCSHAFMVGKGMGPGGTFYAQYWTRDAGSASGTGLSNALQFTVCN